MYADFLADVLRGAGLNVVEHAGWQRRGRGPLSSVSAVVAHHTGGPRADNPRARSTPSLQLIIDGRGGPNPLAGPLSNLYLARDGTFHVVAAGRCNHAGASLWRGVRDLNWHSLGIEAENAGDGTDPWPAVQVDAYCRGVAALLRHVGLPADAFCGHKECALPKGRKIDPSLDMAALRGRVAELLARR